MVDECDADWLSRQLVVPNDDDDGERGEGGSADDGGGDGAVLVLDCRSPVEYRSGHVVGAIHLTIPTLMLRRLRTGCLPVESVINCQDARERFSRHWKTKTLVLIGGESSSSASASEEDGRGGEATTCARGGKAAASKSEQEDHEVEGAGLVSLLVNRLQEDGCTVRCLKDGFSVFHLRYPELCAASLESETTILGLGCLRLSDSATSSGAEDSGARCLGTDVDPVSPDNSSHFPVEVLPNLYLGNAKNSADFENLHKNGIKYILNVTPNVPNKFENNEQFQYLQLPICDHWSQNMTAYFPQAIAFIEEARRKKYGVLVHCLAGISRSVTITVAYLMYSLSLSLNDAYDHVKRCKPNISPNFNFMGQLLDYERTLRLQRDLAPPGECGGGCCCVSATVAPPGECRCRLVPPSERRCRTPMSADSGGGDLTGPCASCDMDGGGDRLTAAGPSKGGVGLTAGPFLSSSSSSSSSAFSSTAGVASSSSSSSSSNMSSAFNYELSPPSSNT